jgi:hypothetical protein
MEPARGCANTLDLQAHEVVWKFREPFARAADRLLAMGVASRGAVIRQQVAGAMHR